MTVVRKNSKNPKKLKNNENNQNTREIIFRYERLSPSLGVAKCPFCTLTTGFYMNDYEEGELLECESCGKKGKIEFQEKYL